jgi:serine/threonine-protein kinase RsbW
MPPVAGDHTLTGLAVPEGLDELHDLLEQVGAQHPDVSSADLMLFQTAVIEIAGNVVEHGQPPGGVHWTFSIDVLTDRIEATLADDGKPFEDTRALADAEMPDTEAEDGRGFALASQVLDELSYERRGGANVWAMVRRRS